MVLDQPEGPVVAQASTSGGDALPRRQLQTSSTTKTYAIKSGDTVANIAGNLGITTVRAQNSKVAFNSTHPDQKDALRAYNPQLNTRKDKQRLKMLVGSMLTVPIPENENSTIASGLGPLNCQNNQVMVSCSTDSTCQKYNVPDFGCIDESLCIQLYNVCKAQNPNCPSCCIRCRGKNPEANNNQMVGYYLLTFNDGSAHCDPWGWWW